MVAPTETNLISLVEGLETRTGIRTKGPLFAFRLDV